MLIDDNLYLVRRVVLQTGYRIERGLQQTFSVLFYDFVISRLLINMICSLTKRFTNKSNTNWFPMWQLQTIIKYVCLVFTCNISNKIINSYGILSKDNHSSCCLFALIIYEAPVEITEYSYTDCNISNIGYNNP